MSAIARLEVIPARNGAMSTDIARAVDALEDFEVSYETTATDTVLEADDVGELFAAAEAAHRAVDAGRVITTLEVDDDRARPQHRRERVESVERVLGRPARRDHTGGSGRPRRYGGARGAERGSSPAQSSRYLGATTPWAR